MKFGTEIRIDATLQDVTGNRTIALKAQAAGESDLPDAIQRLAGSVRENLSLSPSVIKELAASAFKPSSHSVQALRYYTEGLELGRRGTHLDAVKKFRAATDEDPQFALAYSKLAESYSALGHSNDAETYSGKAVGLSEGLPSQEKYLILANRARILHDDAKAIEYYETLHKTMPGDDDVLYSLATLYENAGRVRQGSSGIRPAPVTRPEVHRRAARRRPGRDSKWQSRRCPGLSHARPNPGGAARQRRGTGEHSARAWESTIESSTNPQTLFAIIWSPWRSNVGWAGRSASPTASIPSRKSRTRQETPTRR